MTIDLSATGRSGLLDIIYEQRARIADLGGGEVEALRERLRMALDRDERVTRERDTCIGAVEALRERLRMALDREERVTRERDTCLAVLERSDLP